MDARLAARGGRAAYILPLLASVAFAIVLATSVRQGWNRAETDFPNYYTAAVVARKGEPLRNYYDWTWFQRQMNYAGIEWQLGGYIPQTPVTMLPILGLAKFPVQDAKRIWIAINIVFLAATVWLLSRLTRFSAAEIALLAFSGYGSLHINFLFGQYYIFILFLLALALYFSTRERDGPGGFLLGIAFALKLYGGPFLLYFAVKRRWKIVGGIVAASLCFAAIAIAMFGWKDIAYFATQILPRSLEGETIDPYHPGNGTFSTLLRRSLVMEPELNPQPLWNLPGLFYFLQPFFTLTVLVIPLLALQRSAAAKRDFAWFFVAMVLASPNTAPYTFILLLLPVALLLEEAGLLEKVLLIGGYILLTLPMEPAWDWLFPKVWLLLALYAAAGRGYWRLLPRRQTIAAMVLVTLAAGLAASRSLASRVEEPAQRFERIAVEVGAIYSSSPAVLRSGVVYDSIGDNRYQLRWLHSGRIETFPFEGHAFRPLALSLDGPIQFELVAEQASTIMLFDPPTKKPVPQSAPSARDPAAPASSPDGKWIAFAADQSTGSQIWLRSAASGTTTRVTGGNCNSFTPAWDVNSEAIFFASDCGRGIGLPSLYRASLSRIFTTPAPPAIR